MVTRDHTHDGSCGQFHCGPTVRALNHSISSPPRNSPPSWYRTLSLKLVLPPRQPGQMVFAPDADRVASGMPAEAAVGTASAPANASATSAPRTAWGR